MISREAIPSIQFRPVNHVCRDEGLLEFRLDEAQAFLGLHAVAEIARAQPEIRLGVGEVNRDVGEGVFEPLLHLLGVFQRLVADFHENVDAVAAERAVQVVKPMLFRDEVLYAAVLVYVE